MSADRGSVRLPAIIIILLPWVWYFSAWNFKTRYTKLDSPLGKNEWNLNYFFQNRVIEESRASEVVETRSL